MTETASSSIVMIGTAMSSPGGMTAVVRSYEDTGLFAKWNVRYIGSYVMPGAVTQLRVMSLALLQLLQALIAGRVALVHAHCAARGSFWRKSVLCAAAHAFSVPYIIHIHSGEFPDFFHKECGRISKWWVRRTLSRAASVVALSEHWRQAIVEIAPDARVVAIANPVAIPAGLFANREARKNVIFLGRLRKKKGVFDLVDAIPFVLGKQPEIRFTLAGDGDIDTVRRLAQDLGVADSVEFPGWVDGEAKHALLASAAVLVLPSYFEGLPICVLEAMAAGVPVVASNVGGIPEVLEFGKCGWLVTPGDVPGLGAAIVECLSQAEKSSALCVAARRRIEDHYSTGQVIARIESLYQQIIGNTEGRS